MVYRQAFTELINGSYMMAVNTAYTSVMGNWWIVLLALLTLFMLYVKTRSAGAVAWVTIIGSSFLIIKEYVDVTIQPVLYLIAAMSLAMLLYKVFGPKR